MALAYRTALSLLLSLLMQIFVLTKISVAQPVTPGYQALADLENEIAGFLKDVIPGLEAMPDKASAGYFCVERVFREAERLSWFFPHYKFSVAIADGIRDDLDKQRASELLKTQTELAQGMLRLVRKQTNRDMGICSRFPLAVAKGTELLRIVRKSEDVVGCCGVDCEKTLRTQFGPLGTSRKHVKGAPGPAVGKCGQRPDGTPMW